jgi:uncharacterized protein YdhG (YjbR/CyaY superfamily)
MRTKAGEHETVAARIRAYFAALPPKTRTALTGIRKLIRAAAPDATEGFSYGIPGFRLDGKPLLWYAGWNEHLSVYPITAGIRRALGPALTPFAASKGTVKIPLETRTPVTLLRRMVRARVAEIRAAGKPAKARPARRSTS